MIRLSKSLDAWATPQFESVFIHELEALPVDQLPLQQALKVGNYALENEHSVMIHSVSDSEDTIHARVGVMYQSVIAGCSCADDPTPVEAVNEYCELEIALDRRTGMARVGLIE